MKREIKEVLSICLTVVLLIIAIIVSSLTVIVWTDSNVYTISDLLTEINQRSDKIEGVEVTKETVKVGQKIEDNYMDSLNNLIENKSYTYYIRNELVYWHNEQDLNSNFDYLNYKASLIYLNAIKFDIHPYLFLALGIVESKLNHKAVSQKGAVGIYQITPVVEKKYQINSKVLEDNIYAGARFLRDQLDRYNGDKVLALAHYNAGSRVYHALENYEETINHGKQIMEIYEKLKR